MPQVAFKTQVVDSAVVWRFCARLLQAVGVPDDQAHLVSSILVDTSLRGVDSHGIARLPHYIHRIQHGSINPRPTIRCQHLGQAVAILDGDHGLGHIVMHHAAREATILAREAGAGWVAVKNSSHCGALAPYGLQITEEGMIGIAFSHVDPLVVPHGSKEPFCGTNPICVAVPRFAERNGDQQEPLCLDMATSRVPWNTIVNAAKEGVSIPAGWGVDEQGDDTEDPLSVAALYPFGEHKGSGLGLVIDILCSLLSEAPYGPDIPKMYGDLSERRRLGGLVGAIHIGHFLPVEQFCSRLSAMLARWNSLAPIDPAAPVRFPGEPEQLIRAERLKHGIPVGLNLLDEFQSLADELGLDFTGFGSGGDGTRHRHRVPFDA